jgi:hypothetical protein
MYEKDISSHCNGNYVSNFIKLLRIFSQRQLPLARRSLFF